VSGFSGRDPAHDLDAIDHELAAYSDKLAALPQIVALNKIDMPDSRQIVSRLRPELEARGLEVLEISAFTGQGLQPLLYRIADRLESLPREQEPIEEVARFTVDREAESWEASKIGDGRFVVSGRPVEILVARTDIDNEYALRRLHGQLEKMGVIKRLKHEGAKHGDIVTIRGVEFDFWDEA